MMNEIINNIHFIKTNNNDKFAFSDKLRNHAENILQSLNLPSTKDEEWKYTRLSKIKNNSYTLNDKSSIFANHIEKKHELHKKYFLQNIEGSKLFFINGIFIPELSELIDENGLEIKSIKNDSNLNSNIILTNNYFNSLNTMYSKDGFYINVTKNSVIKQTIQIVNLNIETDIFIGMRNFIKIGDFSNVNILINYYSENSTNSFSSIISEIFVGLNAKLTINKIQQENNSSLSINSEYVNQEKDSQFNINTFTFGGGLIRNDINIEVSGQNCDTNLNGTYLLNENQHVDNHTVIDHKVANCISNELYKGVIDDNATAVFNGKVFVRKDAQKINAFQSNANVLLSENATVNSKPELEIYANDVKCSHGSTTGQLNDEAIFYLRTRGLSTEGAKKLLVNAFINEVIENIENENIREYVLELSDKKLHKLS